MTRQSSIDERLKEFCDTPRQCEYIDAVNREGGIMAAAEALGIDYTNVSRAIAKIKAKAAKASLEGHAPGHFNSGVAPGYRMGKVTVQRAKDGGIERTWERQSPDDSLREAMIQAAFDAMLEQLPRAPKVKPPVCSNANLCTVYTLTDAHVGAYCWAPEGGADWDVHIAERILTGCFEKMIAASPDSRVAVVAQLGDFLHQDGIRAVTPTSEHLLDADGRFEKVIKVAMRILRRVIAMALAKHEKVVVLMAEGNHDISSSIWLRTMFAALYENEPRVEVIGSPLPYYVYQHGETMLAWHHGHLSKNDKLPILFAAQFPKIWGSTTKRYAHTGHRHHVEEKEGTGMHVMQHTTLTARDAYAARGGWIADRAVTAVTYHDKFGKHSTATICPEMLEPEAA